MTETDKDLKKTLEECRKEHQTEQSVIPQSNQPRPDLKDGPTG